MSPETLVSRAITAFLAFAYAATDKPTLQASWGVNSTFAIPLTPELPNNLAIIQSYRAIAIHQAMGEMLNNYYIGLEKDFMNFAIKS
jgi:hypothetical protein